MLTLTPADLADERPVDEAWLNSFGIVDQFSFRDSKRFELFEGIRILAFACAGPMCWEWSLYVGTKLKVLNVKRCNVNHLLLALGAAKLGGDADA